jgi:hypothetical protein
MLLGEVESAVFNPGLCKRLVEALASGLSIDSDGLLRVDFS